MFYRNRVRTHTASYLQWIINQSRTYPGWKPYAERAAVELVRRAAARY